MKDIISALAKVLTDKSLVTTMISALGGMVCYVLSSNLLYAGISFAALFLICLLVIWAFEKIRESMLSKQRKEEAAQRERNEISMRRELIKCAFDGIPDFKLRTAISYLQYEKENPYMICVPHGIGYSDNNLYIEIGDKRIVLLAIQNQWDYMIIHFDPYFKELLLQYKGRQVDGNIKQ